MLGNRGSGRLWSVRASNQTLSPKSRLSTPWSDAQRLVSPQPAPTVCPAPHAPFPHVHSSRGTGSLMSRHLAHGRTGGCDSCLLTDPSAGPDSEISEKGLRDTGLLPLTTTSQEAGPQAEQAPEGAGPQAEQALEGAGLPAEGRVSLGEDGSRVWDRPLIPAPFPLLGPASSTLVTLASGMIYRKVPHAHFVDVNIETQRVRGLAEGIHYMN